MLVQTYIVMRMPWPLPVLSFRAKLMKAVRALKFSKMMRLMKVGRMVEQFKQTFWMIKSNHIKLVVTILALLTLCHLNACLFSWVPRTL